ncbi:alpha-L-fucosidase [Niabella ginsengisoli]|uniref:alpha-L-fucosidase n=1 Tax=Niabella ginsengisoli TaxID=522298 RepID=A0ABS9SIW6_9BACT|nr:alpha-L-fucosidase [Niabella ginsengisoli]MCH5598299.1 alpha-L-fucosidase [Niabella ginsengisoli]
MIEKISTLFIVLLFNIFLFAQTAPLATHRPSTYLKYGTHRLGKRPDPLMQRWRDYGFGQFIHWGAFAITEGQWKGKNYPGATEFISTWNEVSKNEYESLHKQFDPKEFNATAWARQAKEMGVQYMIFTTKHHDGFCLWPSKYTNYTIANSPYKKDIVEEVVNAYDKEGIDVYLYFSIIDWNHPGYRVALKTDADKKSYEQFKTFTANQLKELLHRYPKTKGFWFDGTWDQAWIQQAGFTDSLERELRELHPGLIIGSRFRADEYGRRHFDSNGDLMGDYEQGWERKLPESIEDVHGNDWDCVMTVPENKWGYHSDWGGHVKTSVELIEMMARSVSLDGNFVLNFGPKPQGNMRPEENKLAKEIGAWMKINHEAIYDCDYAGLEKQDWGYITRNNKTGKYYLIIFNPPVSGAVRLKLLPGMGIKKVYDLKNLDTNYNIEEVYKDNKGTEYFIHLKNNPTEPKVIVMEPADQEHKSAVIYEKAKT